MELSGAPSGNNQGIPAILDLYTANFGKGSAKFKQKKAGGPFWTII